MSTTAGRTSIGRPISEIPVPDGRRRVGVQEGECEQFMAEHTSPGSARRRTATPAMTSHDDDDLLAAFRTDHVPEGMLPSGLQRRFIDDFAALYEKKGLMSGIQTPPLCDCCPNARACWNGRTEWKPPDGLGGVSLPWIGPDYPERDGVVVLAMNMNEYGQLPAGFKLASYEHEDFGRGKKLMLYGNRRSRYRGSLLAYRTTRSAASVLDKLDGREVVNHDDPCELVEPLHRIARWNAVKCSPYNRQRSKPPPEMLIHCPEMLLADEMRIAKPTVILTFGVEVFAAVARMPGFESGPHRAEPLWRGVLVLDDLRIDVLGLYHPSAWARRYWLASHAALIRLLRSPNPSTARLSSRRQTV